MKSGDKVMVTSCRDGWTERFVGKCGTVNGNRLGVPDDMLSVSLDGDDKPRIFFEDELAVVEED